LIYPHPYRGAESIRLNIDNESDYIPQEPAGYWPHPTESTDQDLWDRTISLFLSNLQMLRDIVADSAVDLCAPIPHAADYTIFREILVVADHNAYQLGEFAILRQVMGTWQTS
jgi:hypothetical protein